MATITIRNLAPEIVERLKEQAKQSGHSMEQEVSEILEGHKPTRTEVLSRIQSYWPKIKNPSTAAEIDEWIRVARKGQS